MKYLLLGFILFLAVPTWSQELPVLERALDQAIESSLSQGNGVGATILVGRGSEILIHKAYGIRHADTKDELRLNHRFDAASLTKPLATATAILMLVDEGKIDLQAPIGRYLDLNWDDEPTVAQLLTHHSGLPPVPPNDGFPGNLLEVLPSKEPGSGFVYSDTGYLVLQKLVEEVSGLPLDQFYAKRIAAPLKLSSGFNPQDKDCVPTYGVDPGVVHDPRARLQNGVAGHAGLFLTARDVHDQLRQMDKLLKPESLDSFFTAQSGGRSFGLDVETKFSSARGHRFSPLTSAGHTGFTGTSFWWDRPTGVHVVLLTSRLHPDNKGGAVELRREVATIVAEHFLGKQVRTGLDVLAPNLSKELKDSKVGVVCNHTTRDRFGRHILSIMVGNGRKPQRIFTPEHGLFGVKDEKIDHGVHEELKVPIYSLYGETRRPKPEWFEGLDLLLFDLQDVGVRFYTYISTLKYCLEVAKKTGVTVVVLDRPNPLGGEVVDGHLAQEFSFIGCDAIPTVHVLTMGEMAQFLNRDIQADLKVITMEGWSRSMTWDQTGLPFLSPSPNLAELEAVRLYPIIGQIEWCELSVGRGTRSPFRVFGAPYIQDPQSLAEELNGVFKGVLHFEPRFFIPESSKFAGELCGGVEVLSLNPLQRPAQLGSRLAKVLSDRFPGRFKIQGMTKHVGRKDVIEVVDSIPDNTVWRDFRNKYLLY